MIIEIAKLPDEPLVIECRVPWQELKFAHPDARLREDVLLNVRMTLLREQMLRVQGNCQTVMEFNCSRCLQAFGRPQSLKFDLFYVPNSSVSRDVEEVELKYEDLDLGFYDGIQLDTDIVLAEQLVLAIPMKPLCQPSCQGLCPQCGTNLNFGQCDCHPQVFSPYQERLLEIRKQLEGRKK